jgi:hypothetical protein
MDLTTALMQLSSVLQEKLSLLTNSDLLSAIRELSAVPIHPYERVKHDLFGKDYNFKTVNDLEQPNDFCPNTYLCQLTSISQKTEQMSLCALSGIQNVKPNLLESAINIEPEFLKKNIEFVEIVKTIDLKDIQTKPQELVQKLTSFYINNCQ